MKKMLISGVLSVALAASTVQPASAGAAAPPPSGGSNSNGVAVAVILILGAIIFGGTGSRSRNTKTVKPADSDF